jgi:hypothetical protein
LGFDLAFVCCHEGCEEVFEGCLFNGVGGRRGRGNGEEIITNSRWNEGGELRGRKKINGDMREG